MKDSGYRRPKRPEDVREAILVASTELAVTQGVRSLTFQAVADRAGVTKGGLIHHYSDKAALMAALRDRAIAHFSVALDYNLREDSRTAGRFTRAYVKACLASARSEPGLSLITALWADTSLRRDWYAWLEKEETRHHATDGSVELKLVRLAADGAWLAAMDGADTTQWEAGLIAMTEAYVLKKL